MAKTDLKIKATDSQARSLTSTISYVNPAASNSQLSTLASMINAFTTNVYDHSEKVTTVNVDGEGDKQTPTLQLVDNNTGEVVNSFTRNRPASVNANDDSLCTLQYTGDGDLTISMTPVGCGVCFYLTPGDGVTHLGTVIIQKAMAGAQTGTFNFTIYASETENYNAASFDFTYIVTD